MIRIIALLILAALMLRSIVFLLRGVSEGMRGPSARRGGKAVPLVRDPVCGTYVVPSAALSSGEGAQAKFFCSENCRRAYAMKIAR
jgi:YHS domain-containing protein